MTDIPPKLAPNSRRLSISWLNALRDAVVSRTVRSGPGIRATRTGGGTTVSAAAPPRAGGGKGGGAPRIALFVKDGQEGNAPYALKGDAYFDGLGGEPVRAALFLTAGAEIWSVPDGSLLVGAACAFPCVTVIEDGGA